MKKYLLLALFALTAQLGHSAVLPTKTKEELLQDFSGGLNTSIPSHKLPTNFSPYMRNVFIDDGRIERIRGFQTIGSSNTLAKVTGIFPFVRETGQTTFLVTDSSITLETSDFRSWVFVSSGSNPSALLTWMQVRNKMWGFNGTDFVMTWDGALKVILNGSLNGSQSTPNVPKFRYGTYYQDRIWGFGIPTSASDLYFSATITTDNIIIAPDNQFAWPSNFVTYVGRGDGQVGTALWTYQGLLRAGKEQSIYTIYGDLPDNYKPRKEEAGVGVVSNDSVRILDGDTHYMGQTGIYRNVERISDLIEPDFATFNKGLSSILSNSWDSKTDFERGQFFGSTTTVDGMLRPNIDARVLLGDIYGPDQGAIFTLNSVNTSTGFMRIGFTGSDAQGAPWAPGDIMYVKQIQNNCFSDDASQGSIVNVTLKNLFTGESKTTPINYSAAQLFPFQSPLFEYYQVATGSFGVKVDLVFTTNTIVCGSVGSWSWRLAPATTVQYLSEVSTLTSVVAWGRFDSVNNTNGGVINYFIHSSTSLVNISTQTWHAVSPGAIISEPTQNRFIQWATTITSVSSFTNVSNIDNVIISHIEGQVSDQRAFATDWLNRYWITVSTTTNSTQRITYVKSKTTNANKNAWMPIEGYPIDCYAKAGNVLYGGSVSTGAVYRLDYGTNFDGQPIESIYDTPDLPLGDFFFAKYIFKYMIDGEKSLGGTLTIKSSADERDFTSTSFSISGTGRFTRIVEGVTQWAKTIRLRLRNAETDIGFLINNINIIYGNTENVSNK